MLIKLNGTGETKRVQCPWVSEEEVQRVTDFLRTQGEPVYDDNILRPRDDDEAARRGRGRGAGRALRRRRAPRRRHAPVLDVVAPAKAGPRLQPRGAHRRDDGAPRARGAGQRREGPRGPHRPDLAAFRARFRGGAGGRPHMPCAQMSSAAPSLPLAQIRRGVLGCYASRARVPDRRRKGAGRFAWGSGGSGGRRRRGAGGLPSATVRLPSIPSEDVEWPTRPSARE